MQRKLVASIQVPSSQSGGRPEGVATPRLWVAADQNSEIDPGGFRRVGLGACPANIQAPRALRQEIRSGPRRVHRKRTDPGTTAWRPGNGHPPVHPRHEMTRLQGSGTCAKMAARRGRCYQNKYVAIDSNSSSIRLPWT